MKDASKPDHERTLFEQALELRSPGERAAFLRGACGDDAVLRRRVEALLRAHQGEEGFLPDRDAGRHRRPSETSTDVPLGATVLAGPVTEGPGDIIGNYKLLEKIGEGGCGVVYMAEQGKPVRRRVALKVVKLGMDTKQVVARFEAERQALAMMDHPNIAKIFDGGTTESGRPYFVMELVRGVKITEYCDQAKLSTRDRLELFTKVCQAVHHAHQKGIIHRDLKPSNILVTINDGVAVPKVIDFGIAKATEGRLTDKTVFTAFTQFIGTPAYMSPEQALMTSLDIDTRSDIYSLGVVLYEMLTGKTPLDARELLALGLDQMRVAIREKEAIRPSNRLSTMGAGDLTSTAKLRQVEAPKLIHQLRGDLDWIVMKALEKDRSRRYDSANGFAADIRRHMNHEAVQARPPSAVYRFQKLVRRNKLAFASASCIAAALVLGVIVSTWQAALANRARHDAEANEQKALKAEVNEREERQRATLAESESRQQVLRLSVANGVRALDDNDPSGALLWFVRSLNLVQGNAEEERIHRLRCASVLGQCPRLVHLLESPPQECAAFSPDGRAILTTGDGGARVWDASTGEPITPILMHGNSPVGGAVWHGTFSPDGTRVITSSIDKTARIWDARSGQLVGIPLKHSNWVNEASFSPDSRSVVTASVDYATYVLEVATGQPVTPPLQHEGGLRQASFSPDGKWVLTASYDGTARIWDAMTGALLHRLEHAGIVFSAVFSPDGRHVATGSEDNTARLWEASSGKPIGSPLKHTGSVMHVCFSPDGRQLVTAARNNEARLWNLDSSESPHILPYIDNSNKWPTFPVFSPNGQFLVTANSGTSAQIYDAHTGKPAMPPLPHNGGIAHAVFSPDFTRLVTACKDGLARVWDIGALRAKFDSQQSPSLINRVTFSPGQDRFVIPTGSNAAQLFDAATRKSSGSPLQHGGPVVFTCFSGSGDFVATVSRDGTARIWETATGLAVTPPLQLKPSATDGGAGGGAAFSKDGRKLVTATLYDVQVWDAASGKPITQQITEGGFIEHVEFSADGRQVVVARFNGTARVWDAQSGQATTPPLKHSEPVTYASFNTDGSLVVTASFDRTARIWDAKSGEPVSGPFRHQAGVLYAGFNSHSNQIMTVTEDGAWTWNLVADTRAIQVMELDATIQAGRRIDRSGSIVALTKSEVSQGWHELRAQGQATPNLANTRNPSKLDEGAANKLFDQLEFTRRSSKLDISAGRFFVDLSPHVNVSLTEDLAPGGAKQTDFTLAALPSGRQTFNGIEFEIGSGIIQLAGGVLDTFSRRFPNEVPGIKVGRKAQVLQFLYGSRETDRNHFVARYLIRFRNGQTWEIQVNGQDLGARRTLDSEPHKAKRALLARVVPSGHGTIRILQTAWENPFPDVEIESIDYISQRTWGAAYLLAITLE